MAENFDSVHWISFGDGTFNNSSVVNPLYTPGPGDISNGSVRLKIIAYGANGSSPAFMDLTILESPLLIFPSFLTIRSARGKRFTWAPMQQGQQLISGHLGTLKHPILLPTFPRWAIRILLVQTDSHQWTELQRERFHPYPFQRLPGHWRSRSCIHKWNLPGSEQRRFYPEHLCKTEENIGIRILNSLNILVYEEMNWVVFRKVRKYLIFQNFTGSLFYGTDKKGQQDNT